MIIDDLSMILIMVSEFWFLMGMLFSAILLGGEI